MGNLDSKTSRIIDPTKPNSKTLQTPHETIKHCTCSTASSDSRNRSRCVSIAADTADVFILPLPLPSPSVFSDDADDPSPRVACAGSAGDEDEAASSHGDSSMSRSTCRFSGPAVANKSAALAVEFPFAEADLAWAALAEDGAAVLADDEGRLVFEEDEANARPAGLEAPVGVRARSETIAS